MKKIKIEKIGVVAEYNNKYWGIKYEDGRCCCHGFVEINEASISDPEYCKKPTDMTCESSSDYQQLLKAKLVTVKKTTIYDIGDN